MSAPRASGVCRNGVANVLSTTSSAPAAFAAAATAAMSTMLSSGLVGVSIQTSRRVRDVRIRLGGQLLRRRVREAVPLRLVDLGEHAVRTAVDVVHADDVVARVEQVHDRRRRTDARCERVPVCCVLERREALLERGAGRVARPRIVVALVHADAVLRKRRGLVDRGDHRAGRRVGLLARVDRPSLELHAAIVVAFGQAARAISGRPFRGRSPSGDGRARGRTRRRARPSRRTPSSRWKALTTSAPAARSDLRSARPTTRSRQRSGRT